MIRYFTYTVICVCFLLLEACSLISTATIWKTPDGWQKSTEHIYQWKHSYDDYVKINENLETKSMGKILPSSRFCTNTCFILDSIKIYPEDILGYTWFIGPPYLPLIPNLIEPFRYFRKNKSTNYHLMISLGQLDTAIKLKDLYFFSNNKEIAPKIIEEIEFVNKSIMDRYIINNSWDEQNFDECLLYSNKTYLIIFRLNKNSLKYIEIRYKNDLLIHIKRKITLYHEIIFAS